MLHLLNYILLIAVFAGVCTQEKGYIVENQNGQKYIITTSKKPPKPFIFSLHNGKLRRTKFSPYYWKNRYQNDPEFREEFDYMIFNRTDFDPIIQPEKANASPVWAYLVKTRTGEGVKSWDYIITRND